MHMGVPKTVAVPATSTCSMVVPGMVIMPSVIIMGVVMFSCAAFMRVGVRICCGIMLCGAGFCMAVRVWLARRVVCMTTG